ncbi:MAG: helix-turn-helix transcriptional regulator [Bacteroidales bacterium]|nr:helix-turn-helix transcriptional regulator [Bacteroidales bacterium]
MKLIDNIGKMVKFHRKKAGLNQKELADLAGLGKTVVFDIEKGKETVKLNTLLKVLEALNIKINFNSPLMDQFIDKR